MKEIMIDRICYKGGKVTGQKMLEIHKLCDCYKCRTGYVPRKKEIKQWHMQLQTMKRLLRKLMIF